MMRILVLLSILVLRTSLIECRTSGIRSVIYYVNWVSIAVRIFGKRRLTDEGHLRSELFPPGSSRR
jgi:hypothetical protein